MYFGDAVFKGPNEVEVGGQTLRFRKAVIATGGRAMVRGVPLSCLSEPFCAKALAHFEYFALHLCKEGVLLPNECVSNIMG